MNDINIKRYQLYLDIRSGQLNASQAISEMERLAEEQIAKKTKEDNKEGTARK